MVQISTMMTTRASLFLVFIIFIWCGCMTTNAASVFNNHKAKLEDDLYWILGVKRTATMDDIQKAYRQRAKETHPDKNSSPDANEEFRRVAAAFEMLSNPMLRKQYDAKFYQDEQRKRRVREQERQRKEMKRRQAENERKERQRRRADMINRARLSYGDMVKVGPTMEEFQEKMLDVVDHHHHQSKKKYTFRTHCLIMFVSNKHAEKVGEEEIHFPYPFAGEVGQQQHQQKKKNNNPYANVLQVTKIRFNSQTDLTQHFGAVLNSNTPHIIFGKKGNDMSTFEVFNLQSETRTGLSAHNQFKKFVDSLYFIQVTVTNMHSLPVDVFIMRNDDIIHKDFTFDSGYQQSYLSLHAGDRIFAFDTRLDTFPGATRASFHEVLVRAKEVLLLDVVVTTDNAFLINTRQCVDLSTKCHSWNLTQRGSNTGQCTLNPEFMHNICPYTCGVCNERRYFTSNNISYLLFHRPLHMFPQPLQRIVHAIRFLMHDVTSISRFRKNVAMGLFAFGLLVVFNIVLFRSATVAAMRSYSLQQSNDNLQKVCNIVVVDPMVALRQRLNLVLEIIPILVVGSIYALLSWMVGSSANEIPSCLTGIRSDLIGISKYSDISTLVLIAALIAGIYLRSLLSCINRGDMDFYNTVFFIFVILTIICAILTAITLAMDYNTLLMNQWQYLLRYHKNAATWVVIIGAFTGVGLVSIHRLLLKPLRVTLESIITSLSFPAILSYVIILAALGGLVLGDPHFITDLNHVLKLYAHAATYFSVLGMITGYFFVKSLL